MRETSFFEINGEIPKLLKTGVWKGPPQWLFGAVATARTVPVKKLQPELYLEFANLPVGPGIELSAYLDFLAKWGVFNQDRRYLRGGSLGDRIRNTTEDSQQRFHYVGSGKSAETIPAELGHVGWLLANEHGGFFAIRCEKFWEELSDFTVRIKAWAALRDGSVRALRESIHYSEWVGSLKRGLNIKLDEQPLPGKLPIELERSEVRSSVLPMSIGTEPSLNFKEGRPHLVVNFDTVLPVLKAQFVQAVLTENPLIACRRCGRIAEAQRETRIYCSESCAHATAQAKYTTTSKGKATLRRHQARFDTKTRNNSGNK